MPVDSPEISLVSIALSDEELDDLRTAIDNQTYDNFEFIPVVGEMSIPEAWNTGIRRASGDIIVFTESDVLVPEDWLEAIATQFEQGDDFVMGYEVQLPQRQQSMSSTAIRSDWAKETPFNEDLLITEDTEWFARLMDKYDFEIEKTKDVPVVFHQKDQGKYSWAFYHGIHRAEIWLDYSYGGKSASDVTSRRLRRIFMELITLLGQAIGVLKHPKKFFRRIFR